MTDIVSVGIPLAALIVSLTTLVLGYMVLRGKASQDSALSMQQRIEHIQSALDRANSEIDKLNNTIQGLKKALEEINVENRRLQNENVNLMRQVLRLDTKQ